MSADIRQWQESEGRSDEEMAEILTDRLGRPISTQGYRIGKNRRSAPAEWLHALNIAPQEPSRVAADETEEMPASEGPDRRVELPLPFDPAPVRMQIIIAYTVAGKGAALALRSPQVAEVWAGHAPQIAEAYVAWAKEDANVARILNMITLGGPKGELLMLHGSMLVTSLIVSGRFNPERLVPPTMREGQETDNLADDGSPVVDLTDNGGGDDGNARADIPPQPSTTPRTRRRAKTGTP